MTDRISSALTPEEWAGVQTGTVGIVGTPNAQANHQVAAVCLYGQPFGFTREDVEALTVLAVELEHLAGWRPDGMMLGPIDVMTAHHHRDKAIGLRNLAARIAALLPPETP